jgi:ketosteroid isomerase-like protein
MADGTGVVEQFVAAWLRGSLDEVVALLADDVVYTGSGGGRPTAAVRGRDAVAALFAHQVGDDAELVLARPVGCGERVLHEWSYPPAADGSVLRGVDVYTVRDGLIAVKDVFSKVIAGAPGD